MIGQNSKAGNFGNAIKNETILELFSGNDLVIPEIQREYVWGHSKIGRRVLGSFFSDFIGCVKKFKENEDELAKETKEIKQRLEKFLGDSGYANIGDASLSAFSDGIAKSQMSACGKRLDSRIGFVYAYVPGYARDGHERRLPAYLIDGQQRVTTFFLMWLHLAKKSGRITEFNSVQHRDGTRAFDFKVRPLTHIFIDNLVKNVVGETDFDFSAIEDATWFLSDYRHDVSVMSMVNALKVWDGTWRASNLDADIAYKYLTNHVSLWLFVMNETAQGEQLYITMNGRGRNLSEDEIIRAKVFRDAVASGEHDATDVGCLFEEMTDFFWTHRVTGELSADKGMKKFFRWVYLLERYENEPDQAKRPQFAAALTNEHKKDEMVFELDEKMFGREEEASRDRITFKHISATFKGLIKLYSNDSQAKDFLRKSMLEDSDREATFQQDCFVILPLLHWMNKLSESPSQKDIALFARYLRKMASKNDVQRNPAQAVPRALELAGKFAGFKDGDLLDFLAADTTKIDKLSQMVFPEEEAMKAKCLLSVRAGDRKREEGEKLFEKFKKLLDDVEEYKSSRFQNDYQISAFLGIHVDWEKCEWNQILLQEYTCAFNLFKEFWGRPNSLQKFRLLVTPEMDGYYETSSKLFPYDLVSMFGDTDTINKIVNFGKRVIELKSEDAAFKESERAFLNKHWDSRSSENNPRVLCALALIVQRLAGAEIAPKWTKIQYANNYYENKIPIANHNKMGLGGNKSFFWFMESDDKKWQYGIARESNLLQYHKMTPEEADRLVITFRGADDIS